MTVKHSVLITGATSDIGAAIARRCASNDLHVFAHVRDGSKGNVLVEEILDGGGSASLIVADLLDPRAPANIVEQLGRHHSDLLALVNNAGGLLESNYEFGVVANPSSTYQVNVFAAYELAMLTAQFSSMESVVNVSSQFAHSAQGSHVPHYAAAKAALSQMTKLQAIQFAPNVRVNAVSPGRTRTAAWGKLAPEKDAALAADLLINRWIEPSEIADAVWFLMNNKACTGTDLLVDGGISIAPVSLRSK